MRTSKLYPISGSNRRSGLRCTDTICASRTPYLWHMSHNFWDTNLDIFQFDHKYDFDVLPPYRSFVPVAKISLSNSSANCNFTETHRKVKNVSKLTFLYLSVLCLSFSLSFLYLDTSSSLCYKNISQYCPVLIHPSEVKADGPSRTTGTGWTISYLEIISGDFKF